MSSQSKPYNLTYFIRLFTVATFADHFFVPSRKKPYKTSYIEHFIRYFDAAVRLLVYSIGQVESLKIKGSAGPTQPKRDRLICYGDMAET